MANQQQIIDRTRIGDDESHGSQSQALKILHLTLDVFEGVVVQNTMVLEKSVKFITGAQAEGPAQLGLRQMSNLVFVQSKCFERAARQVAADHAQLVGDVVGNLDSQVHGIARFHAITLRGPQEQLVVFGAGVARHSAIGPPEDSVILGFQIRTIAKSSLLSRIRAFSAEELADLESATDEAFGKTRR